MTKRLPAGVAPLLAAITLALSGPERTLAQASSQLQGRVLSAVDAQPVAHARLVVITDGQSSAPAFADAEGRFVLAAPPAGSLLRVSKAGYGPVDITRPSTATSIEVRLPLGAVLKGRVVDASGRPVVDVAVRVRRDRAGAASDVFYSDTDDRGEYRIGSLAPGRYVVDTHASFDFSRVSGENLLPGVAEKLHGAMLQTRVGARPMTAPISLSLLGGEEATHDIIRQEAAVSLPYAEVGGAITGTLIDEFGEPAEGVVVRLWQAKVENGRQVLRPAGKARRSDDRGRYRQFHLPAGRYYLTATTDTDTATIFLGQQPFLPVYFPGSSDAGEAWPLVVTRATETAGVDMMVARQRGSRVHGVALDGSGRPINGTVALVPASKPGAPALPVRFGDVDARGGFEFAGVAPGSYVVQAANLSGSDAMHVDDITDFAMQRLEVGAEDVGSIVLTATSTSSLTGRVVIEGNAEPDPREFGLVVLPVDPDETPYLRFNRPDVPLGPNGEFTIKGLTTKIRLGFHHGPGMGWWIKSANIGGIDAADDPVAFGTRQDSRDDIRVVLARTAAAISGRAVNDRGGQVESSSVVVFPADAEQRFPGSRYVRTADADPDGTFTIASLPPGNYLVAAVEAGDGDASSDWANPEALDALVPQAERITLGEGQRATLSLRVVRPAR